MLCQNCKRNDANIHMKRIINGRATEVHLCSDCAGALGYTEGLGGFGLDLSDLFGNLLGGSTFIGTPSLRCPMCGSSFEDIARSGRLGCSQCYTTFYDKLLPSLERIHGKTGHTGKKTGEHNSTPAYGNEEEQLKARLDEAVKEQNYELAAQLRDKIKALGKEKPSAGENKDKEGN